MSDLFIRIPQPAGHLLQEPVGKRGIAVYGFKEISLVNSQYFGDSRSPNGTGSHIFLKKTHFSEKICFAQLGNLHIPFGCFMNDIHLSFLNHIKAIALFPLFYDDLTVLIESAEFLVFHD